MAVLGPADLSRLYDAHASVLALYVRSLTDGAEDAVQEAFVRLARQDPPPRDPRAWLFRVARRRALLAGRGDRRRRRREGEAAQRSHAESNGHDAWFAEADDRIDARHAKALLAELPEAEREVIVARLWGALTFDEIAKLVGCGLTTAHRRYRNGLATLQERLDPS